MKQQRKIVKKKAGEFTVRGIEVDESNQVIEVQVEHIKSGAISNPQRLYMKPSEVDILVEELKEGVIDQEKLQFDDPFIQRQIDEKVGDEVYSMETGNPTIVNTKFRNLPPPSDMTSYKHRKEQERKPNEEEVWERKIEEEES